MKFQKNDIWESNNGTLFLIIEINNNNYPVLANIIGPYTPANPNLTTDFTSSGKEVGDAHPSPYDLELYIGDKNSHPEYFL